MEFKVFTLNMWGIPFVSRHRKDRMHALATELATSSYDVVCLQEIWTDTDYFLIKRKISGAYPHSHYYYSGFSGSGVCIFSKHQIIHTYFNKWMINGYVHKVHHGDWFGGKGVAMGIIRWNGMLVYIYSAHLHAEYNRENDEYLACRVVQSYETAQFIRVSSGDADIVILAGDLNTEPGDLPNRLISNITNLKDAFQEVDHSTLISTSESLKNSFTPSKFIKKDRMGPRIDYIMFRGNKSDISPIEYKLPLPDRVPEKNYSYSDHEAVAATFNVIKGDQNDAIKNNDAQKADLQEAITILTKAISSARTTRIIYCVLTLVFFLLVVSSLCFTCEYDTIFDFVRTLVTIIMCYTFVMASFWNRLEVNAIYSSKLSMEIYMNGLED